MESKPILTIEYCPKCGWLLRAAWLAQELLTTFTNELEAVSLKPSAVNGTYKIWLDAELFYDRKTAQGFPEITSFKRLLRDRIAPDKPLGHIDAKHN